MPGKRFEAPAEPVGRSMHLNVPEFSLPLVVNSIPDKEIQLSFGRIVFDLPVPSFPVSVGKPLPEMDVVVLWQSLNSLFYAIDFRHASLPSWLREHYTTTRPPPPFSGSQGTGTDACTTGTTPLLCARLCNKCVWAVGLWRSVQERARPSKP